MPMVTVQRWGNSEGIRIPKTLREQAGISAGSTLLAEIRNGVITLTPTSVRTTQVGEYQVPSLEDLFANYHGGYRGEEWDTGLPVGREAI